MKKKKRFILGSVLVFLLLLIFLHVSIWINEERKEVLKIGFYDNYPYFYINNKAKVCGYYNDLAKSLSERLNFKVEYIYGGVWELLKELDKGEIDLVFGINKTKEREEIYEFTSNYINEKPYVIYTNKSIQYGDISALNGMKMGYIEGELDNEWFLNYLKSKNINVELVKGSSYKVVKSLLVQNKADFIIDNSDSNIKSKGKNIKEIFEFSSGPRYIVAKKNNEELISKIDGILNNMNLIPDGKKNNNLIYKYFDDIFNDTTNKHIFMILFLIILVIFLKNVDRRITKIIKKQKIINDLKRGNYILYYQPIVDFKYKRVRGFEALIRLMKDGQVLTPYYFMQDIEDANMMKEITLWVLKRAIKDYNIIKGYDNINEKDFYISINVSFNEIEDLKFLNKVIEIVKNSNIGANSICLEIVEKFGADEINKIQENISLLKENGILIAIDDFGVEYSNLDLLKKIDSNIIKLDKFFVDELNDSEISVKVIDFILDICKSSDKSIVIEGVEEKEQVDIIKTFLYEKIYIQGYYFSKPLDIKNLGSLSLLF
ncbi:EAL domain-containing protein [Clostridium perfringens]|nr:EAL domain-containing protein [Clostridium perfringens]MDK0664588.1 EAL domain-containing protein [Clostridium perfringens]